MFSSKFGQGASFEIKRSSDGYVAIKVSFGSLKQKKAPEIIAMLGEAMESLKVQPPPPMQTVDRVRAPFNFPTVKA